MKICPACEGEIEEKSKKCPLCQKDLEILYWEIEQESGEKLLLTDASAKETMKDLLLSGKLKLSNRCRQHIKVLNRVEDGKDYYEISKEKRWRTLKDYTNKVFALQVLYNPAQAHGKQTALIVGAIVGFIVVVAYDTIGLRELCSASLIPAIFWSLMLAWSTPTIVGGAVVSFIASRIYHLKPLTMLYTTLLAYLYALIIGGVIGWPLGYLAGYLYGKSKKRIID